MTLWHHTYPRDSANGGSRTHDGSKPARESSRSEKRWPPLRAYLVVSFCSLVLWLAIAAGLWLLL